jgi:hypothetical protein
LYRRHHGYPFSRGQYLGFGLQTPSGPFGTVGLPDITALNIAVGASPAAMWDARFGVTGGTNVTNWASYIGGISAPYFGSGTNPTVASNGAPVVFSSGGATLSTSVLATFQPAGPSTLIYVGSGVAAGGFSPFCRIIGTTAVMRIDANASNDIECQVGDAGVTTITSAILTSATVRTIQCNVASGGASANLQIAAQVIQNSATSCTPSTASLVLGGAIFGATNASACAISAILYYNIQLSAGQFTSVASWAVANRSAVNA